MDYQTAKTIRPRVRTWQQSLNELLTNVTDLEPSKINRFPYHSEEVLSFVSNLDWDDVRYEYQDSLHAIETTLDAALYYTFDRNVVQMIYSFTMPTFEGSWYTTNEIFLRFYNDYQFIGYFFDFIILGEMTSYKCLRFHQYPARKEGKFATRSRQRVTVRACLNENNTALEAEYITTRRIGWREITLLRQPPMFQRALEHASEGNVHALYQCLESGFDINHVFHEFQNYTVLGIAATDNQPAVVAFLLERNADVTVKNDGHKTPLETALLRGHRDVVRVFNRYNIWL